ncbi:MAG TPA: heparinase II/III family protein, partial [Stellaceae bacterium]|nr:heparinase II/III family protein [Stellaceae bacterium]
TAAVARMQGILGRNATAQDWQRKVQAQADVLMEQPPLTQDWVHDPRETAAAALPAVRPPKSSEGQAAPLDIARLFCLRIQTLAITWLVTGKVGYRERAKRELLAVCDFPNWDGDKFLVTAETAFGAATGYDWLYHSLAQDERERVVRAISKKAINPGLAQFAVPVPPYWTTTAMNWNLVCNSALMIAALSIAEAEPSAARLFSMCRDSIATGFSEYGPDGGWVEGPGYWHYATQYAIYLLDSLATALATDLGLDASPGLAETGLFRLHAAGPSGKLFNFADGEERHGGGYWLFWLARRYRQPLDAAIEEHAGKAHPMDLLWFEEGGCRPAGLPTEKEFSGAGVAILRGDWNDPNTTFLGIKAGANNACEHAHYDLGSFVLDCDGLRWAMDLGPDDYDLPDYFKPAMRSQYYRTGTIGHNTIVIDGACQPWDAVAKIIGESFADRLSLVVTDLSTAYPTAARAWRGFALIDRRHVLVVDEVVPKATGLGSVTWQMHTTAHIGLDRSAANLLFSAERDGDQPARFHLKIVEPEAGVWSLRSATPSGPKGQNPNTGVAKLLLRLEQVAEPLRLAVLLTPNAELAASPRLPPGLQRPLAAWLPPRGAAPG